MLIIIQRTQLEVELESTVNGDLYVCGGYLRYGNDIFAHSYCGGVFIEGLLFGDGFYLPETTYGGVSKICNYLKYFIRIYRFQRISTYPKAFKVRLSLKSSVYIFSMNC